MEFGEPLKPEQLIPKEYKAEQEKFSAGRRQPETEDLGEKGKEEKTDQGMSRRTFLKIGALGTLALGNAVVAPRKALSDMASAEKAEKVSIEINHEKLKEAIVMANEELARYISERSKNISYQVYLGPSLDGTYFYRLGRSGSHEYGMSKDQLAVVKEMLIKKGFPRLSPKELTLVNFTNYFSRKDALPNYKSVVKHFPGGDENLETTENDSVHYDKEAPITEWIRNFKELIGSNNPPEGIMLSHCSYELTEFPEIQDIVYQIEIDRSLKGQKLSDIPASINPVIIRYLRSKLNYKGLIVPDWFNMDSIRDFVDKKIDMSDKFGTSGIFQNQAEVKIFYLAVMAGNSFITGLSDNVLTTKLWNNFKEKLPSEFQKFEIKMDELILETYRNIRTKNNPAMDITDFDFREKIYLFLNYGYTQNWGNLIKEKIVNPQNIEIHRIFKKNSLSHSLPAPGTNDIWNRTGVMTLIQRQRVVENLCGKKFNSVPLGNEDIQKEDVWFDALMSNKEFRKYYDKIEWESEAIQSIFEEQKKKILARHSR